jgi:hypothetical protein
VYACVHVHMLVSLNWDDPNQIVLVSMYHLWAADNVKIFIIFWNCASLQLSAFFFQRS